MKQRVFRLRFRAKLALTSVLGMFILAGCTIWPILGLLRANFDRLTNTNFAEMRQGLASLQAERVARMRQIGNLLVEIPELRTLLGDNNFYSFLDNQTTFQDRLFDLSRIMGVDFLCVAYDRGNAIEQNSFSPWPTLSDLRDYITQTEPARSLMHRLFDTSGGYKGLEEGEFGLWLYRGQLYQVVGLPLSFSGNDNNRSVDGVMIMAAPVTAEMAHALTANHNCELTFLTNDGGVISSLPADQSAQLAQLLKNKKWKSQVLFDLVLSGNSYRTYIEPLVDPCSGTIIGHVVSQTSMAEMNSLQWGISRRVFFIMAGGLLVAVLISFTMSGAVTYPVRELLRGVRRVAGGDLTSAIAVRRRDEIGELALAFNNMVVQLKARHALELRFTESQAANNAKSQFLADMSHEIRTPLHGVIGIAELLFDTDLNERQRYYVQLVKSSSEVLKALISDLLDFSKIEAGKLELEKVEFDLHCVVEDVVELLYQKAVAKDVELVCDIGGGVPSRVCGDPTRVRQILLNLVGNAVKFTEKGEVIVRVSQDRDHDGVVLLRFDISDTGIGISKEGLARLFKSFSQVDASTTRRFGGTGLGLAICKQLCELMGGEISVTSEVGRGSTFSFTARVGVAPSEPPDSLSLSGIRVLVVEENRAVREAMSHQLAILGAEAQGAATDACRIMSEAHGAERPFRVLLISRMAHEFEEVFDAASKQKMSVILIAANDELASAAALHKAGFRTAVVKPIRRSQLVGAIGDALGVTRHASSEHSAAAEPTDLVRPNRRVRVLVAEDNEVNRIVVSEFLGKAGFESNVVNDGRAAVEALSAERYDIVLMDCQMPVMDGFEATQMIRERDAARRAAGEDVQEIPIIALTANASGAYRSRCMAAGMNSYCSKPFRKNELLEAITNLLCGPSPVTAAKPLETTGGSTSGASLDIASLLNQCSGNASLALTVLNRFEAQLIELTDQIHGDVPQEDTDRLARVAHAMKGTAGVVGAEPLRLILAEIEQAARQSALAGMPESLGSLRAEIDRCIACFSEARSKLQAASTDQDQQRGLP
jgi:signal transduction histidine kinase/CheY-like chemotaxis protein/HPt (histidine-containing phosphotransfer) domain-containing protein